MSTEPDRGIDYADGGFGAGDHVVYADPVRIAACHAEWAGKEGPYECS